MKILRISHSSVVSAFRERDRELTNVGLEVRLVTAQCWTEGSIPVRYEQDPKDTFPVIPCRTLLTDRIPFFLYDPFPIIRELRQFHPDVVDIHEEPYSIACLEIFILVKLYSPASRVCFYSAQNIYKRYPWPFRWFERYVYDHSQAAYPCSEAVREVLMLKGYSKPAPVIPLGVDVSGFYPGSSGDVRRDLTLSGVVIGYVGRVTADKGVGDLLEAAQLLAPGSFTLLVIGDGPDRERFQRLAIALGLVDCVRWTGGVSAEAIPEYYRAIDILAVPSRTTPSWKEQFGRVIVEAMACEIPVVGSDSGSIPEVVGDAGMIVPEANPAELAAALRTMIELPELRHALGKAGSDRVLKHYTWSASARQLSDLYETVRA